MVKVKFVCEEHAWLTFEFAFENLEMAKAFASTAVEHHASTDDCKVLNATISYTEELNSRKEDE